MKLVSVLSASAIALAGCSTTGRTPASQNTSPEIQREQEAALNASPVRVGDAFKFNDDARFEVGKNTLALGASRYPNIACNLEVEPPRGQFVQNYVPKGLKLTVSSIQVAGGLPSVEIRLWKRNPSKVRSLVQALQQRGYDLSKTQVDYDAKETSLPVQGRQQRVVYGLQGSRLQSRIACETYENLYERKTIYDEKDLVAVDKQIEAMKANLSIGTIKSIVEDRYAAIYERQSRVEFVPLPRPETEYRLLPINLWQEPRRFDDVKLNSI